MTFRPIAARWFELVTVHKDLARTMECLSRTGAVQLEALSSRAERLVLPDVADQLKAFHELARRYQSYWPPAAPIDKRRAEHLSETLTTARKRLETWAEKADPIIASIEQIAREITDIENLNEALAHAGAGFPDLKLLVAAGPRLQARLVRLAAGSRLREVPALVLLKSWTAPSANYMLVVGRQRDIGEIEGQLAALKARVVPLCPRGFRLRPRQPWPRSRSGARSLHSKCRPVRTSLRRCPKSCRSRARWAISRSWNGSMNTPRTCVAASGWHG